MDEEGQRGPQGGSPQGLPMVESEATEYTLQVENNLQECGQGQSILMEERRRTKVNVTKNMIVRKRLTAEV